MAIPDFQTLMLPVLSVASHGETRFSEAAERLAAEFKLTDDEREAVLPSGKQAVFANRVHWAKTYLAAAGLVENTQRGYSAITPRGRDVLALRPERIDRAFLSQFPGYQEFRERSRASRVRRRANGGALPRSSSLTHEATPDELIRSAYDQIRAALAAELLKRILSAPPKFFEHLIVTLLLAMGYGGAEPDAGRTLGRSGDDGVDGVIDQDALGLDQVYVQAKRYAPDNSVAPSAVRDFFGSLDRHKAAKGLFVTTSTFSAAARETARFLSKRIVLIDGEQLAQLMIRYDVGCRAEQTLEIKKVDEEFFE